MLLWHEGEITWMLSRIAIHVMLLMQDLWTMSTHKCRKHPQHLIGMFILTFWMPNHFEVVFNMP